MKSTWRVLVLAGLVLASCGEQRGGGGEPTTPPPTGPTTPTEAEYTLVLFGAPWCTNCKSEFPKINEALKEELTKQGAKLAGSLLVTSNQTPAEKPSQEVANAYRDFLKLDFSAAPDEWRCKKYKELVKLTSCAIPAGVLVDKNQNVVLTFEPGDTTFKAELIVPQVKSKLQ